MPFLNLLQSHRCLYCFRRFKMRDCALVSTREVEGPVSSRPILKDAPRGAAWLLATVYTPSLQPYATMLPAWVCPHCNQPLPANIIDTPAFVLGVVGGRAAGKSHYIGTLIQTLMHNPQLHMLGISDVIAATGEVAQHYDNEYYQPFFTDRGQLTPTPTVQVSAHKMVAPLVYTITFTPSAGFAPNRLNLVIVDYAGEDYTSEQSLAQHVPFLPYADGLILLVDPLTMTNAKGRLPLHMQQEFATGAPAATVLENIIRVLRRARRPAKDGLIDIPLVLTIAKADLLRYVLPHLGNHPLREDADYSAAFDARVFAERDIQVRALCQELDGPRLGDLAKSFRSHAYSMVSATGRSIDRTGAFGRPTQAIQPLRCLDPLLWLLDKRREAIAR